MSAVTSPSQRQVDAPPGPVLDVRSLGVGVHGISLVEDVSFSIGRGERVGLIGESGSGKSLTGLSLLGLLPEDLEPTGSVRLAGVAHDVVGASERQLARVRGRDIAMVFQEPMTALNPTMRIGDQVAESMLIHGTQPDRAAARAKAVELLDQVRLPDPAAAARAYPHQLSGGQCQRVVVALALANDPELLICDEPTTALDVTVQALVLDLIVRGVRARESAMLLITHDLSVVATACERVLVMYGGRIVEAGPVDEVFTTPRHRYTEGLLAASDLAVVDNRGRLATIAGSVPSAGQFPAGCVFRNRCPRASSACEVTPTWTGTGPAHGFACQHPADRRPTNAPLSSIRLRSDADPPPDDRRRLEKAALSVRDVTRDYRRPRTSLIGAGSVVPALRGVSFDVMSGERFGIVGESGCGKSTLLRILAGLDQPTTGEVHVEGTNIARLPERRLGFLRDRLQMVFQDPMGSLDPRMRVRDIVAEPLVARGHPARRERVDELLAAVGLPETAARRYPHQFSGGQRQRISIARSLAPRPGILLADEPVSALDVSVRAQVLNLISDLVDELDLTLVFVSHDLSVVRHLCQRVAVMNAGEVVEIGPVEQIWNDPQHPYTQRLLTAVPTMDKALGGASTADLAAAEVARIAAERDKETP
ncbi:dipeptide ABC transporter ATP-binding protein [Lapillicoccus sp.]|uniref:dipeptide ABC transporter ATP-binding protein n=1 Tax=Lapillicoccus sp. TaxID=1909287 RepID=UPI003983178D